MLGSDQRLLATARRVGYEALPARHTLKDDQGLVLNPGEAVFVITGLRGDWGLLLVSDTGGTGLQAQLYTFGRQGFELGALTRKQTPAVRHPFIAPIPCALCPLSISIQQWYFNACVHYSALDFETS